MRRTFLQHTASFAGLLLVSLPLAAQTPSPWSVLDRPRSRAAQPTSPEISPDDLRSRLYVFADDSMGGRVLDSRGNSLGVDYIAREVARMRLVPGGDGGSFFQAVPLSYRTLDSTGTLALDGKSLAPWIDYIPRDQGANAHSIDGVPAVYGGTWGVPASLIAPEAAAGKLVVLAVVPAGYSQGIPGTANRAQVSARFPGAAGIAVAGLDLLPPQIIPFYRDPGPATPLPAGAPQPTFLYIRKALAEQLIGTSLDGARAGTTGRSLTGTPRFFDRPLKYPGRNVVAILPGNDPALKGQYVALGAHNDHVGPTPVPVAHDSQYVINHLFREGGADDPEPRLTASQRDTVNALLATLRRENGGHSARPDSIYNGADDDGSGSMGLLEIAESFAAAQARPRRSLVFVWHTGEELGLFGAAHFAAHPTVPRDSIVAQLNMDMIGRGGPGDVTGNLKSGERIRGDSNYVQLIGSRRLSTELGDLAETVNTSGGHGLRFDYSMDANGHPQNIYCRSDHYEYARFGIPIIFFSTGGHADYHQVTDEPQYVDYERLSRVSRFVAGLAAAVANLGHRVVVDQPRPDPNGACRQ
jgi:hypothetical protein